ncbi:MAG: NTP transferase domain-containing protein [Chloroflexi bacterium]|nr:NTP transferase domain-containing protein [Chloroflexota bacterium]
MTTHSKTSAIIAAAGSSQRMGGMDKMFAPLGGRPVLARVVDVFQQCEAIGQIVVVVSQQDLSLPRT